MNSGPHLFLVGASHHTAPLELREKLALTREKLERFCEHLAQVRGLREYAVLNTCNRVEFYGVAEDAASIEELQLEFCKLQHFPTEEFHALRQQAFDAAVARHLLEVAAGLDSQMIGETEILGQVKDAYADAQRRRSAGPVLNRLFQKTFQHAKYVRSNTALTAGQISVANVAVDLAQKIFGDLKRTRVLLVGAGDIGEKTARAFQSREAGRIAVTSRTSERAEELARGLKATAVPFDKLAYQLHEYDVVVCSTAAPGAVILGPDVAAAMKTRRAQPLFFIDLAMPRDVEPGVARQQNVFVYNLDDLARIADENRSAREAEVAQARGMIEAKLDALWKQVGEQLGQAYQIRSDDLLSRSPRESHTS